MTNRNGLLILLTLASALVLSGCGGAAETAGDNRAKPTAPPSVNASSTAPAADNAAQAAPANGAAAAPSPSTTGGATQPNATLNAVERGNSNVQKTAPPKPQIGSGGNDFFIFTQARGALSNDAELKAANITVEVKEGVVTLSGALASAEQKSKAEQIVRAVGGVRAVKNQLRVSGGA